MLFSDVLAAVESRSAYIANRPFSRLRANLPRDADKPPVHTRNRQAAAAYGHESADAPSPDSKTLLSEVENARNSSAHLRRLRRRSAWLLHPDRSGATGADTLAEINARIDRALEALESG